MEEEQYSINVSILAMNYVEETRDFYTSKS
jgi:hypothetical protein